MNPGTPESVHYTNTSPEVIAYFENARRVAAYLSAVEAWREIAVPLANQSIQPPPPPVPPFAVMGYEDSTGGTLIKETSDPVYPQPEPIKPKEAPLPDNCAIGAGYQDPITGRVWVSSNMDTVPVGTVVNVSGKAIKDGAYRKGSMATQYPGWSGPGFYDPEK